MLASSADLPKLLLYDFTAGRWQTIAQVDVGYANWSKDGRYVYFNSAGRDFYRVRMSDHKVERLVSLGDYGRLAVGRFGWWTGLAPDDSLLAVRDISTQEIHSLDIELP